VIDAVPGRADHVLAVLVAPEAPAVGAEQGLPARLVHVKEKIVLDTVEVVELDDAVPPLRVTRGIAAERPSVTLYLNVPPSQLPPRDEMKVEGAAGARRVVPVATATTRLRQKLRACLK
jgi:hypothetical protein